MHELCVRCILRSFGELLSAYAAVDLGSRGSRTEDSAEVSEEDVLEGGLARSRALKKELTQQTRRREGACAAPPAPAISRLLEEYFSAFLPKPPVCGESNRSQRHREEQNRFRDCLGSKQPI